MNPREYHILKVKISAIDMEDACLLLEEAVLKRQKKYVCVCPVSTIMECGRNKLALTSVNRADIVTPDGMPVVWLGKLLGHKNTRRVYGPELMGKICAISARKGYKNYFYGSSQAVLARLEEKLSSRYPGLIISGSFSPPFREVTKEEDDKIADAINRCGPDIVWVGLGSPKQDIWMYEHRQMINAPLLVGVGAAFDFLSGSKPQAPRWIGNIGLEWLFRLAVEPNRLWRRYLIDGTLFICYAAKELFLKRFVLPKDHPESD